MLKQEKYIILLSINKLNLVIFNLFYVLLVSMCGSTCFFNTFVEIKSVSDFLLLTHGFWGPDLS